METSTKVTISLPVNVLKEIETSRESRGESRSEFFRRAAEKLLRQEKEAEAVKRYIHGYTVLPESAEEVEAVYQAGISVLSGEPW